MSSQISPPESAVDHSRGPQTSKPQELPTQILGVHLLVLPDPHERLMEQRPHLVADRELSDPACHGFLAIRHRHNLLSLQSEEKKLLTFRCRLAARATGPADLHVAQQSRAELGARSVLTRDRPLAPVRATLTYEAAGGAADALDGPPVQLILHVPEQIRLE